MLRLQRFEAVTSSVSAMAGNLWHAGCSLMSRLGCKITAKFSSLSSGQLLSCRRSDSTSSSSSLILRLLINGGTVAAEDPPLTLIASSSSSTCTTESFASGFILLIGESCSWRLDDGVIVRTTVTGDGAFMLTLFAAFCCHRRARHVSCRAEL